MFHTRLSIPRRFTTAGEDPFSSFTFVKRTSRIGNQDGSAVFELENVEVPDTWDQVATDILASKYFRKTGVPQFDADAVTSAVGQLFDETGALVLGSERSAKQTVMRLANAWQIWGERGNYFATPADAVAFRDEMAYMLMNQMGAPNTPQWFNTGIFEAYNIMAPPDGNWYFDPHLGVAVESDHRHERSAVNACFPAGFRVLTETGLLPIEQVEEGSLVVTHLDRLMPVRATMQRDVDEPLTTIELTKPGSRLITATGEHPFFVFSAEDIANTDGQASGLHPTWVKAGDLRTSDYVVVTNYALTGTQSPDAPTLAANDCMQTNSHLAYRIKSVSREPFAGTVYNLSVEGDESYVVEDAVVHNCFINRVEDELVGEGSIFRYIETEARLFRNGSGSGANLSLLRAKGEKLSAGGSSSGVMSFMRVADRAAGAIKSGGSCLAPDQLVLTLQGPMTVEQLTETKEDFTVISWDPPTKRFVAKTARAWQSGYKLLVRIVTDQGSFSVSADHPVSLPSHEFRAAGKLEPGDALLGTSARLDAHGEPQVAVDEGGETFVALDELLVERDTQVRCTAPTGLRQESRHPRVLQVEELEVSAVYDIEVECPTPDDKSPASGHNFLLWNSASFDGSGIVVSNTRRAAKMVILNADHPEIEDFIWCKVHEEKKVAALVAAGYSSDFEGEAYDTVSFQNGNNSVRLPAGFLDAVETDDDWNLTARKNGAVMKTVKARDLWEQLCEAAWSCADPGVQFDDLINSWNTVADTERLRGTNPCSEYIFVDNSACNLASLNLCSFFDDQSQRFDVESFEHAVRLWQITLEISVSMSHYPTATIAEVSYRNRTTGLGYANLGALLMRAGLAYDSAPARAVIGAVTALLHDTAYATSAELADAVGPCEVWPENTQSMARVLRNHRRAAYGSLATRYGLPEYEALPVRPQEIDHLALAHTPFHELSAPVLAAADRAVSGVGRNGYRNAQVTVLAPTGCLTPDSLITTDHGLVRLGSLGDADGSQWQDLSLSVLTDEGPRDATKFYVNGIAEVLEVETTQGRRLVGTPEHRVRVVDGEGAWAWKRLAEVAAGDWVPVALSMLGDPQEVLLPLADEMLWVGNDKLGQVPATMDPQLAEFVGYFMGDGSLHSKGLTLCVTDSDRDVADHLAILGKELFGLEAKFSEQSGYVSVEFHSVRLARWWVAAGLAKTHPSPEFQGKGHYPHVPNAVLWTNDPNCYAGFLRGLLDADGTVGGTSPVALSSSNRVFVDDVRTLLAALGILAGGGQTEGGLSKNPVFKAVVRGGTYLERFTETVGFISERKARTLHALADAGYRTKRDWVPVPRELLDEIIPSRQPGRPQIRLRTYILAQRKRRQGFVTRTAAESLLKISQHPELERLLEFGYDQVKSVQSGGQRPTFDLSVPDNTTYVANGLFSHNTIGLVMSCDTTGIEPDFAMVKLKKLAGGGYMRIVNQSVIPALKALRYDEPAIERIIEWVLGSQTLDGPTPVNRPSLTASGLTNETIDQVAQELPSLSDLSWAFAPHVVGESVYRSANLDPDQADGRELLLSFGFSPEDIVASSKAICGHLTVEGSPDIHNEHLPIFDCAVECGDGTRSIHWTGHVGALGAASPHVSGAISKTVNLPNSATVADVRAAYELAYEQGVKCVALYRDGSKLSQPLNSANSGSSERDEVLANLTADIPTGMSPTAFYHGANPPRFRLPNLRYGPTWRIEVGGEELYLRAGEYPDGTLGEIFLDWGKQGSTLRGITTALAISLSQGLQHGVPLEKLVKALRGHQFEPAGIVAGHDNVKMATSVVDAMMRVLGYYYLDDETLVQVKGGPRASSSTAEAHTNHTVFVSGPAIDAAIESIPSSNEQQVLPAPPVSETELERVYGLSCSNCGSSRLANSGTCRVCLECGSTTGCS